MQATDKQTDAIAHFTAMAESLAPEFPGHDLEWLNWHRKEALGRFQALGFPTTRNEAWKYTNVAAIARTPFQRENRDQAIDHAHTVLPAIGPIKHTQATELLFVNGVFLPRHSQHGSLPDGVQVASIARALESESEVVRKHLTQYLRYKDRAFAALNTALFEDGAFILVPRGTHVEAPIQLTFVSSPNDQPFAAHPRIVIAVEEGGSATIIEHYVGPEHGVYLNNVVTELIACDGAVIDHYKLQRESPEAYHIAMTEIRQHRDSNVSSHAIALGAKIARHEVRASLEGPGADCTLNGLYMVDGDRLSDNHTCIDHAKPNVTSHQLWKGIMNDSARGVYTGEVVVRKDAQKINADQQNKNLLLSRKALAESRPQLEIYADDVRCTHGSAIGRLDEDMVFYLRSRGIAEADARSLLTLAFASDILRGFKVKQVRSMLEEIFTAWLPAGRLIGGNDVVRGA